MVALQYQMIISFHSGGFILDQRKALWIFFSILFLHSEGLWSHKRVIIDCNLLYVSRYKDFFIFTERIFGMT